MEQFLQNLLESSNIPFITAFILGLLTAISPCPLATNITAIGYISKDIEDKKNFQKRVTVHIGQNSFIHGIRHHSDFHPQTRFKPLRNSKVHCEIRRCHYRPTINYYRAVHVVRTQAEFAQIRVQWENSEKSEKRWLGCTLAGCTFRLGILSDKRNILLRNAYADVGNGSRRIFFPSCICYSNSIACNYRGVATGFQFCRSWAVLQQRSEIRKWFSKAIALIFIIIGIYYTYSFYF